MSRRLLDLSPERVAAFKQALRTFGGSEASGLGDFYFQARYEPEMQGRPARLPAMLRADAEGADALRVPYGRDLSFEQSFIIAGREDDYLDAAKKWAGRTLKGSDAASTARDGGTRMNYAWNDGPIVGVGRGPMSARVGWDGDWRVRYSRPLRSHPGWVLRASVGQKDGEDVAQFSVGRSLFASTRTK